MEPISFATGVLGLAGLFSAAIDLFDVLAARKAYGETYEMLLCQVEMERVRLLLWGEEVGLVAYPSHLTDPDAPPAYHERLERPEVRRVVFDSLTFLLRSFEESEVLGRRYRPAKARNKQGQGDGDQSRADTSLATAYERVRTRVRQQQQQSSGYQKMRWAMKDKGKFEALVEDLMRINNSLAALLPDNGSAQHRRMKHEVLDTGDQGFLRLLAASQKGLHEDIAESADERIRALKTGEGDGAQRDDTAADSQSSGNNSSSTEIVTDWGSLGVDTGVLETSFLNSSNPSSLPYDVQDLPNLRGAIEGQPSVSGSARPSVNFSRPRSMVSLDSTRRRTETTTSGLERPQAGLEFQSLPELPLQNDGELEWPTGGGYTHPADEDLNPLQLPGRPNIDDSTPPTRGTKEPESSYDYASPPSPPISAPHSINYQYSGEPNIVPPEPIVRPPSLIQVRSRLSSPSLRLHPTNDTIPPPLPVLAQQDPNSNLVTNTGSPSTTRTRTLAHNPRNSDPAWLLAQERVHAGLTTKASEDLSRLTPPTPSEIFDQLHITTQALVSKQPKFLRSSHSKDFAQLLSTTAAIAEALPRLKQYSTLFSEDKQLMFAVSLVYEDLLRLSLCMAKRNAHKKNGQENGLTWLWKDPQTMDLCRAFEGHIKTVEREVQLAHMTGLVTTTRALRDSSQQGEVLELVHAASLLRPG